MVVMLVARMVERMDLMLAFEMERCSVYQSAFSKVVLTDDSTAGRSGIDSGVNRAEPMAVKMAVRMVEMWVLMDETMDELTAEWTVLSWVCLSSGKRGDYWAGLMVDEMVEQWVDQSADEMAEHWDVGKVEMTDISKALKLALD
jgi:hypothetical protein